MPLNWCWRRLFRVWQTARRSNQSIWKEINPEHSLEGLILKLKLQYFGQLMQRADSLEKTLMQGKIEGKRRRGQQRVRWFDGISSSVVPFSSCSQSLPASESFPMSQLFASGGHSIGASTSASVFPVNIQGWFPFGLTGLISLQFKGISRVFSSTTVWKHQFFSAQPSLWSNSHIHRWLLEKPLLWLKKTLHTPVL